MKAEDTKIAFSSFYYYFNDNDSNDQLNSKEKKIDNPHVIYKINNTNRPVSNVTLTREKALQERASLYNVNNQKLSKLKLSSNSGSSSSINTLNKHYRHVSSNNSTSNSTNVSNSNQVVNQLKGKRTNSLFNFKY
jgi:hypothetical protein